MIPEDLVTRLKVWKTSRKTRGKLRVKVERLSIQKPSWRLIEFSISALPPDAYLFSFILSLTNDWESWGRGQGEPECMCSRKESTRNTHEAGLSPWNNTARNNRAFSIFGQHLGWSSSTFHSNASLSWHSHSYVTSAYTRRYQVAINNPRLPISATQIVVSLLTFRCKTVRDTFTSLLPGLSALAADAIIRDIYTFDRIFHERLYEKFRVPRFIARS